MNLAATRTLLDYSAWATDRILDQAEQLTPEQFAVAPGGSLPSVRQILAHALGAEVVWRTRFATGTPAVAFRPEDFADAGALRARWATERAAMRAHLATLIDEDLAGPYRFTRQGTTYELPLWAIFSQIVNHNTQHRAEAAALLTDYGHSPGDLDFLFYLMAPTRG
jgi:uncharacterized damage-inducible protein DinB